MKKMIICISMMFAFGLVSNAQSVIKEGKTFTQVTNKKEAGKDTPTEYKYVDSKGEVHTVMLSSTGKAFIWKTSKKTGKAYKQYLPDVGKEINPEAYKEDKINNAKNK